MGSHHGLVCRPLNKGYLLSIRLESAMRVDWCAKDLLGLRVWLEVGLALCSWWRVVGVIG